VCRDPRDPFRLDAPPVETLVNPKSAGFSILVLFSLMWPMPTIAEDEGGGPDTDPPPAVDEHPVASALANLSWCGTEESTVDLPGVLSEISSEDLILAIADGSVGRGRLAHAIDAVAEIGSADELTYLLSISEDASWMYLGDAVVAESSPEDLVAKQAHVAAEIRAYLLSAWSRRGDLPSDVLVELAWDEDPLPAGRAIALALASKDEAVVNEGLVACEMNEAAVSVEDICGTAG